MHERGYGEESERLYEGGSGKLYQEQCEEWWDDILRIKEIDNKYDKMITDTPILSREFVVE